MWANASNGGSIRLFEPVRTGHKPRIDDNQASFIGGYNENHHFVCGLCSKPQLLLAQLFLNRKDGYVDSSQTLRIFACNSGQCYKTLLQERNFADCSEVCTSTREVFDDSQEYTAEFQNTVDDGWDVSTQRNDTEDWDTTDSTAMQSLDEKLQKAETLKDQQRLRTQARSAHRSERKTTEDPYFAPLALHVLKETVAPRQHREEKDDVGLTGSDAKILAMIARYRELEDDPDILSALNESRGNQEPDIMENEEELSIEDRCFFEFTDRLKRSPRQVIRLAYGGKPLWSIPEDRDLSLILDSKKLCKCGYEKVFACQLVPTILHILRVDSIAGSDGMDWGSVAIYVCTNIKCDQNNLVVIQKAADTSTVNLKEESVDAMYDWEENT